MSEERPRGQRPPRDRKSKEKPPRETINIQFARGLSSKELGTILQLELIRARSQKPQATEVSLPTEIVHDIKFRLRYYARMFGEVDRKKFFDEKEDQDEEETE